MDNSIKSAAPVAHSLDDKGLGSIQVQNADELRLAQMGTFNVTKASNSTHLTEFQLAIQQAISKS